MCESKFLVIEDKFVDPTEGATSNPENNANVNRYARRKNLKQTVASVATAASVESPVLTELKAADTVEAVDDIIDGYSQQAHEDHYGAINN